VGGGGGTAEGERGEEKKVRFEGKVATREERQRCQIG